MCNITGTSKKTKAVGYKAVLVNKKSGKVFSPATFLEYKPGKVKPLTETNAYRLDLLHANDTSIFCHVQSLAEAGLAHSYKLSGNTSVFVYERAALLLARRIQCSLKSNTFLVRIAKLEISRKSGLLTGYYSSEPILAGDQIISVTLTKDKIT